MWMNSMLVHTAELTSALLLFHCATRKQTQAWGFFPSNKSRVVSQEQTLDSIHSLAGEKQTKTQVQMTISQNVTCSWQCSRSTCNVTLNRTLFQHWFNVMCELSIVKYRKLMSRWPCYTTVMKRKEKQSMPDHTAGHTPQLCILLPHLDKVTQASRYAERSENETQNIQLKS